MFSWLLNLWLRARFHDIRDIPDTKRKYQFPHWTMPSIYFWQERLLFFFIFVLQICCSVCFPFGNFPQHFGRLYLQQRFLVGIIDWWDILLYFHLEAEHLRHVIVSAFNQLYNLSQFPFAPRCIFFDMNDLSHHWIHSWFDSWFLQGCLVSFPHTEQIVIIPMFPKFIQMCCFFFPNFQ